MTPRKQSTSEWRARRYRCPCCGRRALRRLIAAAARFLAFPALDKTTTTVAMDFGRVTLDAGLILYLFGTRVLYLFGTPGPAPVLVHVDEGTADAAVARQTSSCLQSNRPGQRVNMVALTSGTGGEK